jgi:molybdate transport system regulatory protein
MISPRPIRLLLSPPLSFGPGKAELLEKIDQAGSLQGAAAAMDMSYMKAWKMVKRLNAMFLDPLVTMQRGGKDQGGASLTERGREVLSIYHEAVAAAEEAVVPALARMNAILLPDDVPSPKNG